MGLETKYTVMCSNIVYYNIVYSISIVQQYDILYSITVYDITQYVV